MNGGNLATIDSQSQLVISSSIHHIRWLQGRAEVAYAVEIVERALVRVWALEGWAASEGLSPEEAEEALQETVAEPHDVGSKANGVFRSTARRKKRTGAPLHEIRLPDRALWVLFVQGEGAMLVRRHGARISGKVLLARISQMECS